MTLLETPKFALDHIEQLSNKDKEDRDDLNNLDLEIEFKILGRIINGETIEARLA